MYKQALKKFGYKITKSREVVIDFLQRQAQPVSAQDIFDKIRKDLDKVTVYRILEVLQEVGLVFKEYSGREALYYLAEKQHHHIVCRQCGHMECLPCHHFFPKIKNFSNISHRLTLSGLCDKCSK